MGEGSLNVFVNALATSETSVRNAFVVAVAVAIANVEGGGNAIAIADVEAAAYGEAVAQTLADTVIAIQSDAPGGNACASAFADASATAEAFAQVLVEVRRRDISYTHRTNHSLHLRSLPRHRTISASPVLHSLLTLLLQLPPLPSLRLSRKPAELASSQRVLSSPFCPQQLPDLTPKSLLWPSPSSPLALPWLKLMS